MSWLAGSFATKIWLRDRLNYAGGKYLANFEVHSADQERIA